ncbi:hypothetical protein N7507_005122 [Penicillium longicatenatum]|nr:hypothetical protein N7507_005122 [Penicillium longicatenatum]
MPSSFVLPHLSQIIKLEPEKEPFCAGYAPSQGRRCHASTNAYGRRRAMNLLDEATEELHAGRCIDDLLEELAPHVLCRRWHQSQASDLIARWQKNIRSFMRLQSPSRRESTPQSVRQPIRVTTRPASREPTRDTPSELRLMNVEQQFSELYQTLQETLAALRRLQAQQTPVPTQSSTTELSISRAQDRSNVSTIRHTSEGHGSVSSTQRLQRQTLATQPVSASRESRVRDRAPRRDESRSSSRSATIAPALQLPSQAILQAEERATYQTADSSLRPNVHVTRRVIEGPCGICLEALKSTELDDSDEEEGENYDNDSESDDEYLEEIGEHSDQEDSHLVFCKAQCGNNFHDSCLREWLKHSIQPTCPMCRCSWED